MFPRLMCVEQKVSCSCTCPPNSFERSDHIVFCSQIVRARTISCAKRPPRLAQVYGIVSELLRAWHKSYDMCRAGTNSDIFRTECASQVWGFAQVFRARARFWETQNFGRFARMHAHFFGTCTSCSTRNHRSRGFGTVVI